MNCNVHVFCKMIFSNKFGFILETSLFLQQTSSKNKAETAPLKDLLIDPN